MNHNLIKKAMFHHVKELQFNARVSKPSADESDLTKVLDGKTAKETYIHEAMTNSHFFIMSGETPTLTDSVGNPWSANDIMG